MKQKSKMLSSGVIPMAAQREIKRRDFLRTLGAGASVAVTASGPLAQPAAADSESGDDKRKARYKETDHVKAFYRVNRYPTK
ncbi:MAG: twin-arginine translocation signal domain-containing protein [Steroidobacteraceae bacterium]